MMICVANRSIASCWSLSACLLLAVYPEPVVTGESSKDLFRLDPRRLGHAETASSHLVLTRFTLRFGVNVDAGRSKAGSHQTEGATVVFVSIDNQLAAIMAITDPMKDSTPAALKTLHELES